MKNKCILLMGIILFTLMYTPGYAQDKMVRGTITDPAGVPLPGVNVIIKGTQRGTSADFDGNYSISAPTGAVLVFSSIGSLTVERTIGQSDTYDIVMEMDNSQLDEVVVVGYGTQKKSDVTGAIAQVSTEDLNDMPVQNILQGMQGKAAGVDISSNARPGEIGVIRVRGNRSISGGNSPLYVVDGVPLQSGGLEMLNTNDIESIEILKDASSTAIYGSRGANGVVLVTTKKGKTGRVQINFDTSVTMESIVELDNYYNAAEYAEYRRDALRTAGLYNDGSGNVINNSDPAKDFQYFGTDAAAWESIAAGYSWVDKDNLVAQMDGGLPVYNPENVPTTNWTDYVERTGIMHNNNLSITMGTDKIKTYFSGGYLNQKGTVAGQEYKRYTALLSLEMQATDWLTVGGTINASHSIQDYGYSAGGSRGSRTLYEAARSQLPFAVPFDAEGEYIFNPGANSNIVNPIRDNGLVINQRTTSRMFGSFFGEVKLAEGLRFKTIFGPDIRNFKNGQFQAAESSLRGGGSSSSTNYARLSQNDQVSWTLENLLFYDRTFNDKHTLGVTLLQSSSMFKQENSDMTATDLPYDSQLWHNLGSTNNGSLDGWGSGYSKNTLTSYMARVNYSFMDRYLLTATGRADGASVLSDGNKWDFFPSFALGWKLDEEAIFDNASWIDQLKLRAGFGAVGNSAVSAYGTAGGLVRLPYVFGSDPASGYVTGDPKGTNRGSIPNSSLGWERTEQWNYGLDFGLWNNRVSGSVDYYVANTNDILLSKTPNSVTGYGSITVNAGKTQNKGVELVLSTVNVQTPNFNWSTDLTFTRSQTEIVELLNGDEDDINNRRFIGEPLSVFYDYRKIGIWQTEDAAEMQVYNDNGSDYQAGDIRVEDLNNDGIIDPNDDRQIIGTTDPDWTGGLINTFAYKNFELSTFFFSRWGHTVEGGAVDMSGQYVHRKVDYWMPDNPTNAYPIADFNNGGQPIHYSSMNYQDGSFIKLRYVTLAFNFPNEVTEKLGMGKLKIYAQALNPYLYSKTDFLDSDSSFQNSGSNNSASSLTTRSFVFGINATF